MANLEYKTRGNSSPQGKPRVYFCCHPEDFGKYFGPITDELLEKQDCAIWYIRETVAHDEVFLADLQQMQLFVMPVTTNLLCTENEALDRDFKFAVENYIPVLPLMQETGLEDLFNKKCGDLQFLDKNNTDTTAISYDDKLQKYLESVLIGDELAQKIRDAFDAYVFLSYRKRDRKYAQELMHLIHKNEFCRNIAIWYDEFLTPGENFNDSIRDALKKSGLFVLAVTPNIVNEANYIMTTEYPMAKHEGKLILPAEIVPTDRELLLEKYAGIPEPADAHNGTELSDALLASYKQMAIKENAASPEHNFFIGLAYLGGVDVEVDYARAVELITSAAEDGLTDAMEKLIQIYETGIGVACDYSKVVFWQRKLYEKRKNQLNNETTEEEIKKYSEVVFGLSNNLKRMGFGDEAIAIKRDYYDFYEGFKRSHCKDNWTELAEVYEEISLFYGNIGLTDSAKAYTEKAFALFQNHAWEYDRKNIWRFMDTARRMLRLCDGDEGERVLETITGIVVSIERAIQESAQSAQDHSVALLSDVYEAYARMLKDTKKFAAAEQYYLKSYALIAENIDFDQAINGRMIERLFSALHGLKGLKLYEDKEDERKQYALQTVDLRLRYIQSLEAFEQDTLRRMRLISDQYSEIANYYRSAKNYPEALYYSEKNCEYIEKIAKHNQTIENARLLDAAYYDVIAIYKTKERWYSQELNDEEKQNRTCIVKKRTEILCFIMDHYRKELPALYAINRICNSLTDLIEAHLSLGETNKAIHYAEEKLKYLLDRYEKTKYLLDAYNAYYDMSDFYKKLGQQDKQIAYYLLGLEYEEKEIRGHYTRENQERLAYLYRKAGDSCFAADMFAKGYELLIKSLKIKIEIHKAYNDFQSAKALYFSIWNVLERIEKKHPENAEFLKGKMAEIREAWPNIY